jgi:hypothetical protein
VHAAVGARAMTGTTLRDLERALDENRAEWLEAAPSAGEATS